MSCNAIQVVTTTAGPDDARRIASELLARRLAACVQIDGPLESVYRWQGQVETSNEWRCVVKTRAELYARVEAAIRELHSYEQPEILAIPVLAGSEGYLRWLADETPGGSDPVKG